MYLYGRSGVYRMQGKNIIELDRVIFKDVNDDELNVINKIKSGNSVKKYLIGMLVSAIIIVIVFIIHGAGLILKDNSVEEALDNKALIIDVCKKCGLLMTATFIGYNAISLFYTFVKRQLVSLTENYYILLEAEVCDKYSGRKLTVEGKEKNKKYVVFQCDQGICSKAIDVDKAKYKSTKIGDKIVVLKSVTVDSYTLNYLKEDEYRNIYNTIVKNS